jgi:hypothetical protein
MNNILYRIVPGTDPRGKMIAYSRQINEKFIISLKENANIFLVFKSLTQDFITQGQNI